MKTINIIGIIAFGTICALILGLLIVELVKEYHQFKN
jgi:hypothetical protein